MHEPIFASTAADPAAAKFDAWHPGLDSEIPRALAPLATVFRPENAFTGFDEVHELAHFTGLAVDELAIFRPERLVVHELLVRVTADLSVPDGPRQEDLGIEFRRMVHTILARHIEPHMADIVAAYETLRRAAVGPDRRGALAGARRARARRRRDRGATAAGRVARPLPPRRPEARAGPRRGRLGPRGAHRPRVVRGRAGAGQPAAPHRLPRARARRLGGPGAARAAVGRQVAARADRARHRVQRPRHRGGGRAHRAARPARGGGRGLPPAPRPGAAGRHEHEGRVRLRQEHDASAAAPARRRARPRLGRLRRRQPGHLAQVPARLRRARRGVQVRRRVHRRASWRSSTTSSTATWRARPSTRACRTS